MNGASRIPSFRASLVQPGDTPQLAPPLRLLPHPRREAGLHVQPSSKEKRNERRYLSERHQRDYPSH